MTRVPVRRSQLIAPFGVGGMIVAPDGTSMIGAGLDHWYQRENGEVLDETDLQEFCVQEERLEDELKVDHFRLPPDFRHPAYGQNIPNSYLTMPYLRFPQWHVCPRSGCRRLEGRGLAEAGRLLCSHCEKTDHKRVPMHQVPFIAMCDLGHVQDFPFREWVHEDPNPPCSGTLTLTASGGGSLAGQRVACECGASRSLANVTVVHQNGEWTYLSYRLKGKKSDGKTMDYPCPGHTPWLGTNDAHGCGRPIRGSLRSAMNVYFAQQRSAIHLPRDSGPMGELLELFNAPPLSTMVQIAIDADSVNLLTPQLLRATQQHALRPYSDSQIAEALKIAIAPPPSLPPSVPEEDAETTFRRPEYAALREPRNEPELRTRRAELEEYEPELARYFGRLTLIDTLKETRAFTGFTRVFGENSQALDDRKGMLWRTLPGSIEWLPAYVVHGEGIYLELDESKISGWERRVDVAARIAPLREQYRQVASLRRLQERPMTGRFVVLHTLAHLLMLRLTFECGYSAASLRERLYISDNEHHPMAGVLIYTADGDSEGTLGGLVRMGGPDLLEPVVHRALEMATWCSADPVCMEVAGQGGQGPNSLNLAACHSCALVPETSCELFNCFLDRGLLIGSPDNAGLGYFSELVGGGDT